MNKKNEGAEVKWTGRTQQKSNQSQTSVRKRNEIIKKKSGNGWGEWVIWTIGLLSTRRGQAAREWLRAGGKRQGGRRLRSEEGGVREIRMSGQAENTTSVGAKGFIDGGAPQSHLERRVKQEETGLGAARKRHWRKLHQESGQSKAKRRVKRT